MLTLILILAFMGFMGLLIYSRDPASKVNRLYLCFCAAVMLWVVASFLADNVPVDDRLIWARITYAIPSLVFLCLIGLSRNFPAQIRVKKHERLSVYGLVALTIILSMSPYVIKGIDVNNTGTIILAGSLYYIYLIVLLIMLIYAVVAYRIGRLQSNRNQRSQALLIAWGFLLSFSWAFIFSGLLPAIITSPNSIEIGPEGTIIFVAFTAYAIFKHRLFDIHLIVARSMAYFLSLASLVIIFAIGAFSLTGYFVQTASTLRLSYTIMAIVLALLFAPLKNLFDKMTNTVFYQDAYDAQAFLDRLNKTILDNIELSHLLHNAAAVIEQNLKCKEVTFLIYDQDAEINMAISSTRNIRYTEPQKVMDLLLAEHKDILVRSNYVEHDKKLLNIMEENNIAVAANLHSLHHSKSSVKSFMLIGEKKSGNYFTDSDIRVLQIVANELVIAIQNSLRFEEIQRFNETLQQRVADATKNLRRANDKLKTLDETKDDFISMASHQLRTPLTSIKGYLSMLLEGDAGDLSKMQKDMVSQSYISAQRMVYLISDMLNVSRLKTGKFSIDTAPVNLADLVQQEIEQVKETAASRGLTIEYEKPEQFPILMLDETKMRQVVMNFADNAIYYTPHGGHIEVKLINKEHSVDLKVIDNGIGVPANEKHHLFTKFYRAKNSRAARPDGTGLGLYMAQKIIVAQSGAIIFDSQEGKGSTFGFTFSKAKLKVPEGIKPPQTVHA